MYRKDTTLPGSYPQASSDPAAHGRGLLITLATVYQERRIEEMEISRSFWQARVCARREVLLLFLHVLSIPNHFVGGSLLCLAATLPAQPFLSVTSSTDGNGLFTYTFGMANPSYVWGVFTNQALVLPSYGILGVTTPPGWNYFIEDDHYIHLQPDAQPVFIGEPSLTFSVLSSFTSSTMYTNLFGAPPYERGIVVGTVFSVPDHAGIAGGYEMFEFLGPQVVPEPGVPVLLCLGAVLAWPRMRRQVKCFRA